MTSEQLRRFARQKDKCLTKLKSFKPYKQEGSIKETLDKSLRKLEELKDKDTTPKRANTQTIRSDIAFSYQGRVTSRY